MACALGSRRWDASRVRSSAKGCAVATTYGARPVSTKSIPRSRLTRNAGPSTACPAVAATAHFGLGEIQFALQPRSAGEDS